MVQPDLEPVVTRLPFLSLAIAGALAALLLGGCGRKGPLDPPPGAWFTPPGSTSHTRAAATPTQTPAPPPQEYTPEGKPLAPPGPQRRIPADWLLE